MRGTKRFILTALALLLGISGLILRQPSAAAAGSPGIAEVIDSGTMLMEDGSLWTDTKEGPVLTTNMQIVDISKEPNIPGYGLTSDGHVITWSYSAPTYVDGVDNLIQVSGPYGLRKNGTVWGQSQQTKLDQLSDVVLLGNYSYESYYGGSAPYLLKNGEVWSTGLRNLYYAKFEDASVVKALAGDRDFLFVLTQSGEVLRYSMPFPNQPITAEKVADHAVQIAALPASKVLLIVGSDGTVGKYVNYNSYDREFVPVKELAGVRQISGVSSGSRFYVQLNDKTWSEFNAGTLKPVNVPGVTKVELALSSPDTIVGGTIKAKTTQTVSTGAVIDIPFAKADIKIEKPHLLKKQDNGTFKGLGVGETKITFASGGVSQTVTVSISLDDPLLGAKQVAGVTMLPIKSVFQALGGTVTYKAATKTFDILVGNKSIKLTTGSAKATVDNKAVSLGTAVQADGAQTLFPAKLLTSALGASLKWNASWKYMDVSFGKASMSVYSEQTLTLLKKQEQGALANLIGRTYWVNRFQGWERFIKLTIVDIVPDYKGDFSILFRKNSSATLETYTMTRSLITETLNNRSYFLNYDPYKKYNWSAATWKLIKAEHVATGMTKDQVRMSWGDPTSTSQITSRGIKIETWGYGLYNYVTFTNGKVTAIYQY